MMKKITLFIAIFLLCLTVSAQDLNLKVGFPGSTSYIYHAASLETAINNYPVPIGTITQLEITAGDFTAADWEYLKNNTGNLTSLATFTITDDVNTVANIPNTSSTSPYFNANSFTTISIPKAVAIGENAFRGCSALTTVNFSQPTSIGSNSFYDCSSLTTANFPQATSIGNSAFYDCSALSTLQLGETVPTVGTNAFENTPATRNLVLMYHDTGYSIGPGTAYDNAKATYDAAGTPDGDGMWEGWTIAPAAILPLTIQINGTMAGAGTSLEDAIGRNGVSLTSITQLKITAGDFTTADWTYLRINARYSGNLNNLANFTITDGVTSVADIPDVAYDEMVDYYYTPYFNRGSITTVSVAKVNSIGQGVLNGFSSLTSVSFPQATSIGNDALQDCSSLSTLQLGAMPPTVGTDAFNGTPTIRNLVLVDAMGNPLTVGSDYDTARADYDPDNDGLWYGWTIADAASSCDLSASITAQTNVTTTGGNDGSLTVTPTGGTAPYTYFWDNGATTATITGLAAGTYTFIVSDTNACITTASATITEPTPLQFTTQPATGTQSVTINDPATALSVAVTGGASPYSYQWYSNTAASNTGGTELTGATSDAYTPSTATAGTTYYYVEVTDSDNTSITSNVSGAVTVTAIPYAKALDFDGDNDIVVIPNNSANNITGTQITLEARIKVRDFRTNVYEGGIIVKEAANQGYMLRVGGDGKVNFNLGDGSGFNELDTDNNTLTTGQWYHIAATYDGAEQKIYVNGQLVKQQNMSSSIASTSNILAIGNWSLGTQRGFNGVIDEVRIWDVARTPAEINEYKDKEIPASEQTANLKVYYRLNQGIANANNSSVTSVYNEVSGVNDGNLENFALTGTTSNWVDDTSITPSPVFEFITQPATAGETLEQNATATVLTVEVTYDATSSYQWYSNTTASNTGGTAIAGATSASYTPDTSVVGTTYYYVVVSNDSDTLTSDVSGAITVTAPPCPAPTNLTVANITATTADVGFTSSGSEWEIEYGAPGFTQGSGTTVNSITTNPYTLTGLMAETTYDFYVREACTSPAVGLWSAKGTFTTITAPAVDQGGVGINTENPTASFEIHDMDDANGTSLFKITQGESNTVIFEIKDDGTITGSASGNMTGRPAQPTDAINQRIEALENQVRALQELVEQLINQN